MAPSRSRPSSPGIWGLIGLVFLMITLVAASSSSSSATASTPSPAVEVDLTCHTDDPSDCYPKVFVATDEFQKVHDDQDLPPGLHVRLNVWTGEKEAKINVPGEQNAELEGLPVDSAVVIVETNEKEEIPIPAGAPVYEPVGKIKEPPESEESESFNKSLDILAKGLDIDQSLEQLQELSHDIYYGLKIAENYDTLRNLLCHARSEGQEDPAAVGRAKMAANTVAGALQNNAKALAEVEKHWPRLRDVKCNPDGEDDLVTSTFRLVAVEEPAGSPAQDAGVVKARVSALKGLLKSDVVRKDFLDKGGMESLLDVLVLKTEPEWEPAREKAAFLVQDVFLDGDMGASLGEWPVDDQKSEAECGRPGLQGSRGECWDYEAKRLAHEHRADKGHWSQELWGKLKEARKGVQAKERWKDEL